MLVYILTWGGNSNKGLYNHPLYPVPAPRYHSGLEIVGLGMELRRSYSLKTAKPAKLA